MTPPATLATLATRSTLPAAEPASPGDSESLQRSKRNQRLRWALWFSAGSKLTGVALQMLALSWGVQYLGGAGYTAYAALWAASLAPFLAMMTYGPGLVSRIAKLDAARDVAGLRNVVWSALGPLIVNLLVVGLVASLTVGWWDWSAPVESPDGQSAAAGWSRQTLLIVLVWGQLLGGLLSAIESIQIGFQENHLLSIRSALANLLAILALGVGFLQSPTLFMFIVCLQGPVLALRVLNAGVFLFRQRLWGPIWTWWDRLTVRSLIGDGLVFKLASGLAAYLCHQLPILWMAAPELSPAAANLSAAMNLVLQLFAVVSMLAVPFVPALVNSLHTGDRQWARRNYLRIGGAIIGYGLACWLVLVSCGPGLCQWWFQGELQWDRWLCGGIGCYLLVLGVENYLFLLLCSLNSQNMAVGWYLLRAALTAGIAGLAAHYQNPTGLFWGASFATIVTIIPYAWWVPRRIQSYWPSLTTESEPLSPAAAS